MTCDEHMSLKYAIMDVPDEERALFLLYGASTNDDRQQ